MRKIFLLFVFFFSTYFLFAGNKQIYITVQPADCQVCNYALRLVIDDVKRLGLERDLICVVCDMPKNAAVRFVKQTLGVDGVKIVNSPQLFGRYSIAGTSSVMVVDTTSAQKQVFSFVAHDYQAQKSIFLSLLETGFVSLIDCDTVSFDDGLFGVKNFVVKDDSLALVVDSKSAQIAKFSIANGSFLGNYTFDKKWYYQPYAHDSAMVKNIKLHDTILSINGWKQVAFQNIHQFNDTITVLSRNHYAYYEFDNKRTAIMPTILFYLLGNDLEPTTCGRLMTPRARDIMILNNGYLFDGKTYETLAIKVEDDNPNIQYPDTLYRYFTKTYSKGCDYFCTSGFEMPPPQFANVKGSIIELYHHRFSKNLNRKIAFFTPNLEYLDIDKKLWMQLDLSFVNQQLSQDAADSFGRLNDFEMLSVFPTKRTDIIVFRLKNDIYFAQQYNGQIKQCIKIYTKTDDSVFLVSVKNNNKLYGLDFNRDTGQTKFVTFNLKTSTFTE